MKIKTKYFILAILFGFLALCTMGFASWNIHLQTDIEMQILPTDGSYATERLTVFEKYIKWCGQPLPTGYNRDTTVLEALSGQDYSIEVDTALKPTGAKVTFDELKISFDYKYYADGSSNEIAKPSADGEYICKIVAKNTDTSAENAIEKLNAQKSGCAAEIKFKIIALTPIPTPIVDNTTVFTYNGGNQYADILSKFTFDNNILSNGSLDTIKVSLTVYDKDGNEVPKDADGVTPVCTNAGSYTFKFTIIDTANYKWATGDGATASVMVNINKLSVYLSSGVIEKSYGDADNALSTADICGYFRASDNTIDAAKVAELVNSNFTITATIKNYSTNATASDALGLISHTLNNDSSVITKGSTYLITLTNVGNQSSNMVYNSSANGTLYYKYKTAKVGNDYYSIEDALAQNSDITLAGGSTSDSSYVITAFSKLGLSSAKIINETKPFENYKSDYQYALSHTLVVPFDNSNNDYSIVAKDSAKGVYSVLCVPESIIVTLENGSNLTTASTISYSQPNTTISYTRGVIMNSGQIIVKSGANIYSYGYIKGNGQIDLQGGATAVDCLSTYDWPGGNTAKEIRDRVLPMNAWTLHNISCDMKIAYDANLQAFFHTNAGVSVKTTVDLISNTSTNGLFKGIYGYIMKSSANKNDTDDLNTIAGSNQISGQRDILEIYGEYEDAILSVSVSGFSMTTSTAISCPFSYMDIILKDSTILTLSQSDYLFLPGTSLTVDNGAKLTTKANVDLSFETVAHIETVKSGGFDFYDLCVDRKDAELIVNGEYICEGNLGGKIITTNNTGKLNLTKATLTTSFYSLYHGVGASAQNPAGVAYQVTNFYARGYINEGVQRAFDKITYNANQIGSGYIWVGNSYDSTITEFNGTIDSNAIKAGGCLVEGTLITIANGTKKKVEDITENDILLVFNHYTGTYEYAKVLFNDTEPLAPCKIINLHFSNGSVVRVVSEHGFFDLEVNKYVYIDECNYSEYVGHRFYSATWDGCHYKDSIVTLDRAYLTQETVKVYSPVTKYHMNYFTEDLLSMPGGVEGIFNIFEYGKDLKFDEELMQHDIELYGEFTYDDFKDLVTEDIYNSFQTKYFKVAIGKGNLTMETLQYYINRYAPLMMANSNNSSGTGQSTDTASNNSGEVPIPPEGACDNALPPTTVTNSTSESSGDKDEDN